MHESVRQDLPASDPSKADDHIAIRISAEEVLVIRKAAELIGWTVTDYVLSTALDRAERDLYEHAAALEAAAHTTNETDPTDPYVALLVALT